MKATKQTIDEWVAPNWHSDFGDSNVELILLKNASLFLLEFNTEFTFHLDCYEEGYMRVEVKMGEINWGEINVVDSEKKRIGVFKLSGEEFYFFLD